MAILNYTTKVDVMKTVGEIQACLASGGAKNISMDFESKQPCSLTFMAEVKGDLFQFRLPSNHAGVLIAMKRDPDIPPRYKTDEQARRVAWRILKDWVEAQMAIIEAGQAVLPEVFLAYLVTPSGETLYRMASDRGLKLLTGSPNA